jgi:hypothetical protein
MAGPLRSAHRSSISALELPCHEDGVHRQGQRQRAFRIRGNISTVIDNHRPPGGLFVLDATALPDNPHDGPPCRRHRSHRDTHWVQPPSARSSGICSAVAAHHRTPRPKVTLPLLPQRPRPAMPRRRRRQIAPHLRLAQRILDRILGPAMANARLSNRAQLPSLALSRR